jgi:penicillin amidase
MELPALETPAPSQRLWRKRRLLLAGSVVLLVVFLSLAMAAICFRYAALAALPQLDGAIRVAGLSAPVTVLRDAHGVPAITAASPEDLFFAQGYVTAQDRLWQMDMSRRFAAGELAEVLGADYAQLDIAQRVLGLRQAAEATALRLPAQEHGYFEAYACGVNAYITAHRDSLPLEFRLLRYEPRPWSPADSFLIGGLMSEMLNQHSHIDELAHEKIIARLGPELAADLFPVASGRDILPDGERPFELEPSAPGEKADSPRLPDRQKSPAGRKAGASLRTTIPAYEEPSPVPGSNNWVLSGDHTVSGKPLLANDMHLPHRIPNTWYEVHLIGGAYDVAGVSLPGVPGVIVGHNRRIAWGFTNLGADVQDLYIETFNDRGEYLTPQGWQKPAVRHEVIRVKRGRDRAVDVVVTRHGPIITPALKHETRQLALRWTLYDSTTPATATKAFAGSPGPAAGSFPFFDLDTAGNWEEFRRALARMSSPGQNVVYADVDGHIGYQATGLIPIRTAGDGSLPVNGSDDAHEWTGYIPFDELPRLFDPPSGIIATANNRVTADGYPYLITTDWGGPYRAERIHHVLHSRKKFTRADMLALQNDIYSDLDHFLAERFVYAVDHRPQASARAREAAALLRQWDGRMAADSAAAAIERHARAILYETLLKAKLGEEADQYSWLNSAAWLEEVVLHSPQKWLPPAYGSYQELLAAAVEKAVSGPEAPSNLADWRYGRDFPVEIRHPLFGKVPILRRWAGPGRQPQSGSRDTVKQVGRGFGPSERMTVDFADLDASTLNLVNGESGNLFSPYFNDQWPAWYGGTTFALPFSQAAVEGSAAHRLRLEPI